MCDINCSVIKRHSRWRGHGKFENDDERRLSLVGDE